MKRNSHHAWLVLVGLLFAATHAGAAPPNNPQVVYSFCGINNQSCPADHRVIGTYPEAFVAGPDGAYYGTTVYGGTSETGGSIYRFDPATRTMQALYQFPPGTVPSAWLKASPDGSLYGGYARGVPPEKHEGLFRLSPAGEFTVVHETDVPGFSLNAPVQDSLGNWVGIAANLYAGGTGPDFIYKITPGGGFKVVHTLPAGQNFGYPNYEPVLATDGNLYGAIGYAWAGDPCAIYRLAPDDTFTLLRRFDISTEGGLRTPLSLGEDGALYGVLYRYEENVGAMYRMSLDGQVTIMGDFGPQYSAPSEKLTLMPDGYFYGPGTSVRHGNTLSLQSRLSPAGEYTELYFFQYQHLPMVIRGFDNALYGTTGSGGTFHGGALFRYVPPPAN